jgi:hypothetical protein
MASPSHCAGEPVDFFTTHGYFYERDAAIGNLVPELETRGIAETVDGLSVAKLKLLENPVSRLYTLRIFLANLTSVCNPSSNHT